MTQESGTEKKDTNKLRKKKCRYEFQHPGLICKAFSKLGSCPNKMQCKLIHTKGVCHEWQQRGSGSRGDTCKFRHQLEVRQKHFFELPKKQSQPPSLSQQHYLKPE